MENTKTPSAPTPNAPVGERDSKELNSIATLLNLEYDDVAIGWWLPAEPGPILCASVADAVREALRLADNNCRRATAARRENETLRSSVQGVIDTWSQHAEEVDEWSEIKALCCVLAALAATPEEK